jgi:hypothetical protein
MKKTQTPRKTLAPGIARVLKRLHYPFDAEQTGGTKADTAEAASARSSSPGRAKGSPHHRSSSIAFRPSPQNIRDGRRADRQSVHGYASVNLDILPGLKTGDSYGAQTKTA